MYSTEKDPHFKINYIKTKNKNTGNISFFKPEGEFTNKKWIKYTPTQEYKVIIETKENFSPSSGDKILLNEREDLALNLSSFTERQVKSSTQKEKNNFFEYDFTFFELSSISNIKISNNTLTKIENIRIIHNTSEGFLRYFSPNFTIDEDRERSTLEPVPEFEFKSNNANEDFKISIDLFDNRDPISLDFKKGSNIQSKTFTEPLIFKDKEKIKILIENKSSSPNTNKLQIERFLIRNNSAHNKVYSFLTKFMQIKNTTRKSYASNEFKLLLYTEQNSEGTEKLKVKIANSIYPLSFEPQQREHKLLFSTWDEFDPNLIIIENDYLLSNDNNKILKLEIYTHPEHILIYSHDINLKISEMYDIKTLKVNSICQAGTYTREDKTCSPCNANTYSSNANQMSCSICNEDGKQVSNDKTSCSTCPAGFYCADQQPATECPAGFYCPPDTIISQLPLDDVYKCPKGHYCLAGSKGYVNKKPKLQIGDGDCEAGTVCRCTHGLYNDTRGGENLSACRSISTFYCPDGEKFFSGEFISNSFVLHVIQLKENTWIQVNNS